MHLSARTFRTNRRMQGHAFVSSYLKDQLTKAGACDCQLLPSGPTDEGRGMHLSAVWAQHHLRSFQPPPLPSAAVCTFRPASEEKAQRVSDVCLWHTALLVLSRILSSECVGHRPVQLQFHAYCHTVTQLTKSKTTTGSKGNRQSRTTTGSKGNHEIQRSLQGTGIHDQQQVLNQQVCKGNHQKQQVSTGNMQSWTTTGYKRQSWKTTGLYRKQAIMNINRFWINKFLKAIMKNNRFYRKQAIMNINSNVESRV